MCVPWPGCLSYLCVCACVCMCVWLCLGGKVWVWGTDIASLVTSLWTCVTVSSHDSCRAPGAIFGGSPWRQRQGLTPEQFCCVAHCSLLWWVHSLSHTCQAPEEISRNAPGNGDRRLAMSLSTGNSEAGWELRGLAWKLAHVAWLLLLYFVVPQLLFLLCLLHPSHRLA